MLASGYARCKECFSSTIALETHLESLKSKSEFINEISWNISLYYVEKKNNGIKYFAYIRCNSIDFIYWILIPYLSSGTQFFLAFSAPNGTGNQNYKKKNGLDIMKSGSRNNNKRIR